jgi:hypothetical protein
LLVQPSKKLLRAGEKFTLRATLADEAGCPVEGKVEYAAKQTDGALTVDAHGVVESPAGAKAGNYSVVVSAAGRETTMVVEVVAAEHYDALLAEEGLDAEGEKKASVSVSLPVGGGGEAKSDDPSRRRKMLFLSIVGGLALPLGILAIVLLKRKSRAEAAARALAERHESEVEQAQLRNAAKKSAYEQDLLAHEASVRHREEVAARKRAEREAANAQAPAAPPVAPAPEVRAKPARLTCPVCRTEYEAPMAHCPEDGTRLAPLGDPSPSLPFAPQTREAGLVCPLCKRGFEPGVQMCPTHLEMLVPRALIPPTPGTDSKDGSSSIKGKICPTCGDKFELGARFCGKDGSTLLIIN